MSAVTVIGDEATARRLDRLGLAAHVQSPTMAAAARTTASRIRDIPVDTGRLAASMEPLNVTSYGFDVGSRVPYAKYVFHGTRKMRARPPRVPDTVGSQTARALGAAIART